MGVELETIESTIQLSSLKHSSKSVIHGISQEQKNMSNSSVSDEDRCCPPLPNHKRTPRIIGKRGTRNTEFIHPSSLAYSKQDQLICKFSKKIFLFNICF